MRFFCDKKVISGCEARGDADSPYLTRITVIENRWGKLYLHIFHRSDADDMHDHPFNFTSLILWRGYIEETPVSRRRKWPGMILRRPAKWVHRVELLGGKPAVTLVWRGNYVREWGFWTRGVWVYWKTYFADKGCAE